MKTLAALLAASLAVLPASAGWVRIQWTTEAGLTGLRSGCVAPGQYERPIVPLSGASGTVTVEGLPDAGTCYFRLNAGPQDEWQFDFTALAGGRRAPGPVRNLDVTWSPAPATPQVLGVVPFTLAGASPAAQTLTVPTGTTMALLLWSADSASSIQLSNATLGGRAWTLGTSVNGSSGPNATGSAWLATPASGSLSWRWSSTPNEGPLVFVVFLTATEVLDSKALSWDSAGQRQADMGAGFVVGLVQNWQLTPTTALPVLLRVNYGSEQGAVVTDADGGPLTHAGAWGSIVGVRVR